LVESIPEVTFRKMGFLQKGRLPKTIEYRLYMVVLNSSDSHQLQIKIVASQLQRKVATHQ